MSYRTAPRVATWLLEQAGGRSRFEPLIGDLVEQFEEGRSRLWYWRQAAGTVAISLAQTLRTHAFSFIGAVVTGCALIDLLDAGYAYALQPLHDNLAAFAPHPWTAPAVLRAAGMVTAGLLADVLIFVAAWVVTRIHQFHPRAVLSVVAATVTVRYLPGLAQLLLHAVTDPRFTAALVLRHLHLMMPVAWQALSILAAGLWAVRRPRFSGMNRLTCLVAILAVSLCALAALARAAGLVGEFTYTLHEQYVVDVLDIGSVACLIPLLWRTDSVRSVASPSTRRADGRTRA